jgi:hypothetical protein
MRQWLFKLFRSLVLILIASACLAAQTPVAGTESMSPFTEVSQGIKEIANWLWPIAISMAAVGTLSMALIQFAKDLGGWRRSFQTRQVREWLRAKRGKFSARAQSFQPPQHYFTGGFTPSEEDSRQLELDVFKVDHAKAEEDLIQLATAGDDAAFYDLPTEQLAGQMNAAMQAALDYPAAHRDLLWCVAHLAEPEDIVSLLVPPRDLLEQNRQKLAPRQRKPVDQFVGARNRIAHQIQRAIDGLQIAMGASWKRRMQLWSMGLSAVLGVLALWVATHRFTPVPSLGMFLLTGILAGFLAPVARDLVAALRSLRD